MNPNSDQHEREHLDRVFLYALQALPSSEVVAVEMHLSECAECRKEFETIKPIVGSFVAWPTDVLRPTKSLWEQLSKRIAKEPASVQISEVLQPAAAVPEWEEVALGISVKILSNDVDRDRVSMLVRLAPGTDYPAHCHGGEEELHLLHGELIVDEKRLYPGDYCQAVAGSIDNRVWSETGCTCFLMTSSKDVVL
jgi:anti-sigma factor ChrR (cupin superfamily)